MNEMEVWQRVMAGRESAPAAEASPATEGGGQARQLWGFIQAEFASYSYYAALQRRFTNRKVAEGLRKIAGEEKRHQIRLSTAYFILTGESATVGEFTGIAEKSRLQALRRLCIEEEKAAAKYLEAATLTDDARLSLLYRELAADEKRHGEYVSGLIEQMMG